jgi:hypothetical protein
MDLGNKATGLGADKLLGAGLRRVATTSDGKSSGRIRMIKNLLIAFAVALVAGFGLELLNQWADPQSSGFSPAIPMVLAVVVFSCLQMLSGNRREVCVDDAGRQASLSALAPAGAALLYIYREGFLGKAVGWNVFLDGVALAQLRSPRFTQATVRPGSHTLTVSLGGRAGKQNKPAEAAFEVQPGEVIVFAVKSKMGALSNTLLFVRELDAHSVLRKLSKMPMVAPEKAAETIAA